MRRVIFSASLLLGLVAPALAPSAIHGEASGTGIAQQPPPSPTQDPSKRTGGARGAVAHGSSEATPGWISEAQRRIRDLEYEITWQDRTQIPGLTAAWHAPNRAHNFRSYFTEEGLRVIPRTAPGLASTGPSPSQAGPGGDSSHAKGHLLPEPEASGPSPAPDRIGRDQVFPAGSADADSGEPPAWEWSLNLIEYGRGELAAPVAPPALAPSGIRIDYDRGGILEWFENRPDGIKHGLVLRGPPEEHMRSLTMTTEVAQGGPAHLTFAVTGSLSPRVSADGQVVDLMSPDGSRRIRYSQLAVNDATGRPLRAWMEGVYAGDTRAIRIVFDATAAAYPITIDPLATSWSWIGEGDLEDSGFGQSVGTAGDVNGDGYSDVIVGADRYDNGELDEGRAFVYYGSAAGLSLSPSWSVEANQAGATMGTSVATAGDVNGDGYSDVIVGAAGYTNGQTEEGGAFLFQGSPTGLPGGPSASLSDADWSAEGNQASSLFGGSLEGVSSAGDVNGDGFSDIIVGARWFDNSETNEGRAFVFYGSSAGLPSSPSWTAESDQGFSLFGYSVASAGDVNGDGFSDIIVSAVTYEVLGGVRDGRVFVYHGSGSGLPGGPTAGPGDADWTAEPDQAEAEFGSSVSSAGDVNGDGYSDIIVGATQYDNGEISEGRAFLYFGSASGLSSTAAWTAEGNQESANYGGSVSTAGDVNGDGYADIIVGARSFSNGESVEGHAFMYLGSESGPGLGPAWIVEGNQFGAAFGVHVDTAGDINGDGYSDVIVGAWRYDNGETDEGAAFAFHGGPDLLSGDPDAGPLDADWSTRGFQASTELGFSVATAGDVNGDGFSDIIAGAPLFDNGQADEGMAFLYLGSPSGPSPSPDWSAESDQAGARFGFSVGTAGDVNGDGFSDVIASAPRFTFGVTEEGIAAVYHGSASGPDTVADWIMTGGQFQAHFGTSVSTAGDVNGDGFSDVIVGARFFDNGQLNEGAAFAYLGSPSGLEASPSWTSESDQAFANFGFSVGTAGDVNADGFSDVIVGAVTYDGGSADEGRAEVFLGSTSGLAASPAWGAESNQGSAQFGYSVGTAGDVNGDGFSDVIVGSRGYDNIETNEGRAWVYHGSASGPSAAPSWIAESNQSNSDFGHSVGTAGDVNGDGYSDVIVGAINYDNGQSDEGRAFVYLGSSAGLALAPAWTAESDQDSASFGKSVGSAGDVNGDSFSDVIIGASLFDAFEPDEGALFLYYGNGGGLSLAPQQRRADDSAPIGPLGISDSSSEFRLEVLKQTPFGRGRVKLQWEVKPLGVPLDGTGTQSSSAWVDTGSSGPELNELVSGLTPGNPYHWRVRLVYDPSTTPSSPYGRWVTTSFNGWQETDLRTPGACPDGDGDGFGSPGSFACSGGSDPDCDDANPDVYPGAPQICDGLNNDCNHVSWPGLSNTIESDDDLDGQSECSGDCDDGYEFTYSGAPEVNDKMDNQCPGDEGHGIVDEVTGGLAPNPSNPGETCWTAQTGAAEYEVARSTSPDFSTDCFTMTTTATCFMDTTSPPSGGSFYYRVRALTPFKGSWGVTSSGTEVVVPCSM